MRRPLFNILAIAFLNARGIEPSPELITPPDDNQYQYRLIDRDLAKTWIAYHHELAAIRVIDRRINIAIAREAKVNP